MTTTRAPEGPVTLHSEAQPIQDWRSVCDHIIKRCGGISAETAEFLKLFQSLTETYKQYRNMCDNMRDIIMTQKEYVEVPDYHETAIHKGCDIVQKCLDTMYIQSATKQATSSNSISIWQRLYQTSGEDTSSGASI